MAYRNGIDALKSRHEALRAKLADLAARAAELGDVNKELEQVRRELLQAQAVLSAAHAADQKDGKRDPRALPLLESIRIASPCKANWDDMVGDERARFCGQCAKNVYNLSG